MIIGPRDNYNYNYPLAVWVLLCLLLFWAVLRCSLSFFVVLPSFPSFLEWGSFLSPLLLGGASLPLHSLDGVFWVGLFFPCLQLGGASWPPSLGAVAFCPLPFAWCCLASPPFGGTSPLLLFGCCFASSFSGRCCVFPLLLRGAAFLPPPSLSEAAFSPSSVWWCFISPSSLGGAAFSPSSAGRCSLTFSFFGWCFGWGYFSLLFCWVVPLGLLRWVLLRFTLSPLLLIGCCFASSFVERCCVVPFPSLRCCLPFPPSLGGARFSPLFCWVVLSTFSSFRWGSFPSLFCWLVLPLFLRVGHLLSPSSVGWCFLAYSFIGWCFLGGAIFPFSSVWWCCLASFVGWCCVIPSLLWRGAAFLLLLLVVLLSPLLLFGCCFASSFFGWGYVFPLLLRGASCLLLLLWVGLLSLPLLLEGAALPSLSLGAVLRLATLSFSSVAWCRLASFVGCCCVLHFLPFWLFGCCFASSFVERCCVVPSPSLRCCLHFPPSLGGARFSPLFCWVVLSTFSSFRWRCFPSLFCWSVLPSFPSSFGWGTFCPLLLLGGASLPPPPLGLFFPCLQLGGASWPPSLGAVAFYTLPFAWCCIPSPPLGGAAFSPSSVWVLLCLLLLWAMLRFFLSFFVVQPSSPFFLE